MPPDLPSSPDRPRIARGVETGQKPSRHKRFIERTFAWINGAITMLACPLRNTSVLLVSTDNSRDRDHVSSR